MDNENQTLKYRNDNFPGILAGLVLGGLAGAVTMLFLAPRFGKDMRIQIQEKGVELRDRTSQMVEETMDQVFMNGKKITIGGLAKLKVLKQPGHRLVVEHLHRISEAAEAGKKPVKIPEIQPALLA